ncbi:MAG: DUF721 domain-containing protein [Candidatus Omnitrophota bacterium]
MRQYKKPSHISDAVKEVIGGIDKTANTGKYDIYDAWRKAAGEQAAKHSSPALIRNNDLVINVDSTMWIYQLRTKESELIKNMAALLKSDKIKKIRFRAGEVEKA